MPVFRDRVKDTSSSTGTGDITLSGAAPTGYQAFATAFALGQVFTCCIVDNTSGQWQTCAAYLSASNTLVRYEPLDGSSGQYTLVNFSAGAKDVFVTAVAHFLEDVDTGAIDARIRGLAMP